jgi:ATP synthase protein I
MFKKPVKKNEFIRLLHASSIGIVFVCSIVISVLIGVWLDGKFGVRPWCTLAFLLIGIAAGIKNAVYYIKKSGALEKIENDDETE